MGVSSPYDVPSLVEHFNERGLYRRLYINIMCRRAGGTRDMALDAGPDADVSEGGAAAAAGPPAPDTRAAEGAADAVPDANMGDSQPLTPPAGEPEAPRARALPQSRMQIRTSGSRANDSVRAVPHGQQEVGYLIREGAGAGVVGLVGDVAASGQMQGVDS